MSQIFICSPRGTIHVPLSNFNYKYYVSTKNLALHLSGYQWFITMPLASITVFAIFGGNITGNAVIW